MTLDIVMTITNIFQLTLFVVPLLSNTVNQYSKSIQCSRIYIWSKLHNCNFINELQLERSRRNTVLNQHNHWQVELSIKQIAFRIHSKPLEFNWSDMDWYHRRISALDIGILIHMYIQWHSATQLKPIETTSYIVDAYDIINKLIYCYCVIINYIIGAKNLR